METMNEIVSFEEWKKLELKVGRIISVSDHPKADRLYILKVDLGDKQVGLVAGLKQSYKPEELKDKLCIVFTNLEPAVIRGVKSEGMILAAVNKNRSKIILIGPEKEIELGSVIE
ncbi:MAG: hypothetical protein QW244_00015 [Candidatus Pacearchaeota archaeon]